jgi:hypothetical protein
LEASLDVNEVEEADRTGLSDAVSPEIWGCNGKERTSRPAYVMVRTPLVGNVGNMRDDQTPP